MLDRINKEERGNYIVEEAAGVHPDGSPWHSGTHADHFQGNVVNDLSRFDTTELVDFSKALRSSNQSLFEVHKMSYCPTVTP